MNTQCDRCGLIVDYAFQLGEVKSLYSHCGVFKICRKCGDKANSFVNYWGDKSKRDINKLIDFLTTGKLIIKTNINLYSMLTNAGYKGKE